MSDMNKRNLVYFESPSMRGLYYCMEEWQRDNNRRLLSISVQQDGGNYCCIGLTNPAEVVITNTDGKRHADVTPRGSLRITGDVGITGGAGAIPGIPPGRRWQLSRFDDTGRQDRSQVLDALARKLDGTPASPDYLGRRRRVLYNVLKYAVREHRLTENPLDTTEWEPPETSIEQVNPRVVASPEQVRQLLTAVSYVGPRRGDRLVAFRACLYFAMLRPSEAVALRADDCHLPESGWGRLELNQTTPSVGKQWTDSGAGHEQRGLKNRPRRAVRVVPIPPELVAILRQHIARYGPAPDGRLRPIDHE
jgi:hypothetical protein